jgi:hypothetical protein
LFSCGRKRGKKVHFALLDDTPKNEKNVFFEFLSPFTLEKKLQFLKNVQNEW